MLFSRSALFQVSMLILATTCCLIPNKVNATTNNESSATNIETTKSTSHPPPINQISSNPAAVDVATGNGALQKYLEEAWGIEDNHGIKLGGLWIGDTNAILSGGVQNAQEWTSNSLLVFHLEADTQRLIGTPPGGMIGSEFLQFNGQDTNGQVGSIQGYNSLPGSEPLDRSELYQLWYRQELLDKKLIIRVGKVVPSLDFDNVTKPVALSDVELSIPTVSGLMYTPIFINPTTMGVIPGYYNSAYGVTVNIAPVKNWYVSVGGYDGSEASGVQTGLNVWPEFDSSYFYIGETGAGWLLGKNKYPGAIGIGTWYQDGTISGSPDINESSAVGQYIFGSQRLWYRSPGIDASGISMFYQYGISNSDALPITQYIGGGLTGFSLVPNRPNDSLGIGLAYAWLNPNSFDRSNEMMYQVYYQAQITDSLYFEPGISYIPTPGADETLPPAWTTTLRIIALF